MGFLDILKDNPVTSSVTGGGIFGLPALFGGRKNPAKEGMGYLDEMSRILPQYFKPYMDVGQRTIPGLEDAFKKMLNPGALIGEIGKGFHESPGFQFMKNQGMGAANNAAAAGGMLGTPSHQQESAQMVENLANQDFYNYLNKALGVYGQGTSLGQNLFQTGANASMGLGQDLASIMGAKGNMAFEGQKFMNNQKAGQQAMLMQLMQMLPFFLG